MAIVPLLICHCHIIVQLCDNPLIVFLLKRQMPQLSKRIEDDIMLPSAQYILSIYFDLQ